MAVEADDALLVRLEATRREFLAALESLRPDLHRYCARMAGSVVDGEDLVQDVLARAYFELPTLKAVPSLRSWLFSIAHNRAIDYVRLHGRGLSEPLDAYPNMAANELNPEGELARSQALGAALSRFLELPPAQRSCVILKDVLGHSVAEIADLLRLSVPAVSAALHRGRVRLHELAATSEPQRKPRSVSPVLARYAALFNSRDWDGVRAMLADDVRLDLVSHWKRAGRKDVSEYYTNYNRMPDWHVVAGWLDGRETLAVFRGVAERPAYFIELALAEDRVLDIRDFRYAPYIGREAEFEPALSAGAGSPAPR
jgi:RNA polymerase sigma factor (sigma-70 family)